MRNRSAGADEGAGLESPSLVDSEALSEVAASLAAIGGSNGTSRVNERLL